MSSEEIIEGNKLIAEFMGCESMPFKNEGGSGWDIKLNMVPYKGYQNYAIAEYGTLENVTKKLLLWNFYYHTSWDWLMPVVEKIQPIQINWQYKKFIMHAINDLDINTTWLAVVDFIKFYNQQK